MKNKPISHKNENTFKFIPFAERLSSIHIDVIHRIGKTSQSPEDANTFFQEAIEKWNDLNYTEDYDALRKDIGYEILTLNQVVYRKKELVEILLKHLRNPESMALNAVLELTVALARDLQFEFYPSFPKFFVALTQLLETKDTDLLEHIFTSLSYIFKFLWRYMLKDMENVFKLYSCLLTSENRQHIRGFAAESFAFLIRKVQDKEGLFHFIFHHLESNPEQAEGIGQLFFEVVKGVKQSFHSCTKVVLQLLLKCLGLGYGKQEVETCLPYTLVEKALTQMFSEMQRHTMKNNATDVEELFYDASEQLMNNLTSKLTTKEEFEDHLYRILFQFYSWSYYKSSLFLTQSHRAIQVLNKLLNNVENLSDNCMKLTMDIAHLILTDKNVILPVESVKTFFNLVYGLKNGIIVFYFTRKMLHYGMFEKDILPRLLGYCINYINMDDSTGVLVLEILSETIIAAKGLISSWEDLKQCSKLRICTPVENNKDGSRTLESWLTNILTETQFNDESFSTLWMGLVCLPHFLYLDAESSVRIIETIAEACIVYLEEPHGVEEVNKCTYVLRQAFISWLAIKGPCKSAEKFCLVFFIDLLKEHSTCVNALSMFSIYLNSLKNPYTLDDVAVLVPKLVFNLSSPFHQVRLLTLRILCSFHMTLPANDDEVVQEHSVFHLCLQAEMIQANVQGYRERLKWLRKLEFPAVEKHIPNELQNIGLSIPVHFLLGSLYINFSLLWQPTIELLCSYTNEAGESFWKIFKPYLYKVVDAAEEKINCSQEPSNSFCMESNSLFEKECENFCKPQENPDVLNHRLLLWKAMGNFSVLVRQKNPDIVPLLFRFIEKEMAKADSSLASTETVTLDSSISGIDVVNEDDSEVDEFDDENDDDDLDDEEAVVKEFIKRPKKHDNSVTSMCETDESKPQATIYSDNLSMSNAVKESDEQGASGEEKRSLTTGKECPSVQKSSSINENSDMSVTVQRNSESHRKRKKSVGARYKKQYSAVKVLSSMLSLFSKFKKPSTLHRSEDLQKLYYELLSYQNPEVQKLAFDCIMTYNYSFLVEYKENFYKILDDKTFKTEIVLFSIDKDNEVIQKSHRMDTLAVLMRILYGKMLRKTGNNTQGKAQAQTRKALVLRFLAGCHSEELEMFLNLVFDPFKDSKNDDALIAVKKARENLDLSSVVPIRKLQSVLSTLEVILHSLGGLAPELLPWFLKILLIITATASALLEKRDLLIAHCVKLIKMVRRQAIMCLIQFFKSFDHYSFSLDEVDAIFQAVVWPSVQRLESESLVQPPPLLRLFDTWCSNSRYFILLNKHNPSAGYSTPLHYMMELYTAGLARPRVIGLLSKMFHSLLTLHDCDAKDDNEMPSALEIRDCMPLPESQVDQNEMSYGMQLLLPHVHKIVKRLEIIVGVASSNSKRSLDSRELTILLKISAFIEEKEKCSRFIVLLLKFFSHQKKLSADCEVLVLSTVDNLMKKISEAEGFLRLIAPLFGILSNQRSRHCLVDIISTIGQKTNNVQEIIDIIIKINAWNQKQMEEPDYQTRLDGHSEALALIDKMGANVHQEFLRILVYNSAYMIRSMDDISLRDSSSYLMQQLVPRLSNMAESKPDVFKLLIFDTLLPEVKKGLKSKTEAVRNEFIRILASVLRNCGSHKMLIHLAQLCNEDKEMDFWENILHLQVHRRARALLKFASQLNSGELEAPVHILVSYVIPIISSFFFDSAYKKHVHVIDAAIETFGAVAKQLPWSHYEPVLKYYLRVLPKHEHHKTIVKIVVSVLNAFHFDLSASAGIKSRFKEPPPTVESKEKENIDPEVNEVPEFDASFLEEEMKPAEADSNKAIKDILDKEKATKIHYAIATEIVPRLNKSLMQKSKNDDEHKLAGSHHPEDQEVLRVPIALAIVKLLQNLPHGTLERHIPGLFLKMCNLLKSKTESIRSTARETLVKMMQSLGPRFFPYLLHEMRGVMKRGYQVHVLSFTVNAVLQHIKPQLQSGDLDSSIEDLTEVCMNELFGETAEEKEVAKITGKLKEARSNKSYAIWETLSQYVSEENLGLLIAPLKEKLNSTHSHKAVKKIQECLRHIALGIGENSGVTVKGLLIFTHSLLMECMPLLCIKSSKSSRIPEDAKYIRPDIYLIPKEPGRSGLPVKTSIKTNAHFLVDFSLQLLYLYLKHDKLKSSVHEHLEMVDPFIKLLSDCLDSNNIKIISMSLRCLLWLFKFDLPSLKTKAPSIVSLTFVLLHKYAGVGMAQGENFEMVVMCFKLLTVVVRDTNYYRLNEEQLRVLLSYIEQDIYDHTRQATAFSLLKAILSKKLQATELSGVMCKIADMSITSELNHIRVQCRQASLQFMLNYPLKKNLQETIGFYVNQLEYLHQDGRVSAFEMISSILNSFSPELIKKYSGLILVPVSARLVNDEASQCRKMAASAIKTLLHKVDHDERNKLFSVPLTWMTAKKMSHRRLGVQLCGLFAEVEGQAFEQRLNDILSPIRNQLKEASEVEEENAVDVRCKDHFLYHLLNCLAKVMSHCKVIRNEAFTSEINSLFEFLQKLILYPHLWTRLAVSQLFGLYFSTFAVEEVLEAIAHERKSASIFFATRNKLRDLSADFATQLQSPFLNESLGEQVIKNLVYLAKVISHLPESGAEDTTQGSEPAKGTIEVSLAWMVRKLCREIKKEVAFSPQSTIKRKCVFQFLATVAHDLDQDKLFPLLADIFTPLCREVLDSSPHTDESLKSQVREVLEIYKNAIGIELYTKVYALVQSSLIKKKRKRKQETAKEAVTNPKRFAQKKIKKQQNKKEAKKRKILMKKKGLHKNKRIKLSDLAVES